MDSPIERSRPEHSSGCREQVAKARGTPLSAFQVMEADAHVLAQASSLKTLMVDASIMPCGCRIAENGCIDNSECRRPHLIYPVPSLSYWCDKATARLIGAGHLIFWECWARPSILGLTSRCPSITQTKVWISRTAPEMRHTFLRYDYRLRYEGEFECDVVDIIPKSYSDKKYPRVLEFLNSLPGQWRIGRHLLLRSTTDPNVILDTAE